MQFLCKKLSKAWVSSILQRTRKRIKNHYQREQVAGLLVINIFLFSSTIRGAERSLEVTSPPFPSSEASSSTAVASTNGGCPRCNTISWQTCQLLKMDHRTEFFGRKKTDSSEEHGEEEKMIRGQEEKLVALLMCQNRHSKEKCWSSLRCTTY